MLTAFKQGDENTDGSLSWDEFKELDRHAPNLGLRDLWRGNARILAEVSSTALSCGLYVM